MSGVVTHLEPSEGSFRARSVAGLRDSESDRAGRERSRYTKYSSTIS